MRKIFAAIAIMLATLGTAQAFAPEYPGRLVLLQQGAWDTLFLAGPVTHTGNQAQAWIVVQGRYEPGRDEHRVAVDCTTGRFATLETRRWSSDRVATEHVRYARPEYTEPEAGTLSASVRRICIHK